MVGIAMPPFADAFKIDGETVPARCALAADCCAGAACGLIACFFVCASSRCMASNWAFMAVICRCSCSSSARAGAIARQDAASAELKRKQLSLRLIAISMAHLSTVDAMAR
ncbi:MAG: hypothetical protein ACLP1D_26725 [Xanthobacteraceae bacterium]